MGRSNDKIIIAGTGRSGTTFLMQVLTEMGFDTGFDNSTDHVFEDKRAGMEHPIQFSGTIKDARKHFNTLPRVLKSPYFSSLLKLFLDLKIISVSHVIIPIRNLKEVANSRVENKLTWLQTHDDTDVESQRVYSGYMLGSIIEACVLHNVPYTTIVFPDFIEDKLGTYKALRKVFDKDFGYAKFSKAVDKLGDINKIQTKKEEVLVDDNNVIEIVGL